MKFSKITVDVHWFKFIIDNVTCGSTSQSNSSSVTIDVVDLRNVTLRCSANYYGSWAPNVELRLPDDSKVVSSDNLTNSESVSYTFFIAAVNRSFQDATYECSMAFSEPPEWVKTEPLLYDYDETAPDFNTFCLITFNVLCKETNSALGHALSITYIMLQRVDINTLLYVIENENIFFYKFIIFLNNIITCIQFV